MNPEKKIDYKIINQLDEFISKANQENNKIILITSGGTSVPLEKNTVRSIENFSTGKRGALCAEEFLYNNYKVIFLYRDIALQPFFCHFTMKDIFEDKNIESNEQFIHYREQYKKYSSNILSISFNTIENYLLLYEVIIKRLAVFNKKSIIFLAAAASDFYIPNDKMVENKIQSREGNLKLELFQVKKEIYKVKSEWNKNCFLITFKLETDKNILMEKANKALKENNSDLVIANLLPTRYNEVFFLNKNGQVDTILKGNNEYIEKVLVKEVIKIHQNYIENTEA